MTCNCRTSLLTVSQSREGVSLILSLIRESRLQPMTLGAEDPHAVPPVRESAADSRANSEGKTLWTKLKTWLYRPPQ